MYFRYVAIFETAAKDFYLILLSQDRGKECIYISSLKNSSRRSINITQKNSIVDGSRNYMKDKDMQKSNVKLAINIVREGDGTVILEPSTQNLRETTSTFILKLINNAFRYQIYWEIWQKNETFIEL